ncbi:MAG: divergent polysaccharide deacetylase family protein [Pseudomonadota bacterium]|nr:divergent polysaccharide deacetylase family protein [Pseudomonadota bacterium]
MSDEETKAEADNMVDDNQPDEKTGESTESSSDIKDDENQSNADESAEKTEESTESPSDFIVDPNKKKPDESEEPNVNNISLDPEPETDTIHQEDTEDLKLNDIDLPDGGFDEEDETSGGKKKWIFIGSGILLVAVFGGAGIFYINDSNLISQNSKSKEVALSLKIPRKSKLKKGRKKMISSSKKLLQESSPTLNPKSSNTLKSSSKLKSIKTSDPAINTKKPKTLSTKKKPPEPKNLPDKKTKIQEKKSNQSISGAKILADGSLVIPSVTAAAFKGIPMMKNPLPLSDPDKSLGESVGGGVIPKISTDGRRPWKFYGKTFNKQTTLPRISIIIKDLGLSKAATTAAINHTPSEVTLAFNPYAKGVANWVSLARAVGHETLIKLPMEPMDFPISDPGPFALQVSLQETENIDRLRYILSVSMGNVGLMQMMGTRFVTSRKALEPILKEIHSRGLLMIDNGLAKKSQIIKIASAIGLPRARSNVFIDQNASRSNIKRKLSVLESIAKKNRSAVGIAQPLPNSISLIMSWSKTLAEKKLILAPISAIVKVSGNPKQQAKDQVSSETKK